MVAVVVFAVTLDACRAEPIDALTIDPTSLSRDLVAHWTFDTVDDGIVRDSSGNGYHGQLTGGTRIAAGRFQGALSLASGDSVAVADFPQATARWTASLWIRISAADLAASTSDWSTILSNETQFAGGWEIHLDNRPGYQRFDAAYFAGATFGDYVRVFCECLDAGRWIHLTTVWDAPAARMTLFRDGQLIHEAAMPGPIQTGDKTLYLGRWNQAGRTLAADLDDFAIWRRALQPAEIASLLQNPPGD